MNRITCHEKNKILCYDKFQSTNEAHDFKQGQSKNIFPMTDVKIIT
jgi:hypothetical protein